MWAVLALMAVACWYSGAHADDLGLDTDAYSAVVLERLAADFPGVTPLRRLQPGAGTHAVFVVAYPDAPGEATTAVVKVLRMRADLPWTEARVHASIAAAAVKAGVADAIPAVYGVADLSVRRPRARSQAAAVVNKGNQQHGAGGRGAEDEGGAGVDRDGRVTRAILMQHLEGYAALTSLPVLRPRHLLLAATAVARLHSLGFAHGDLHFGNILVRTGGAGAPPPPPPPQQQQQQQQLADGASSGGSAVAADGAGAAAVIDFQSAKRWVVGKHAPARPELGVDGVPIATWRENSDRISLATEDLDSLRRGTSMTRREALEHALAELPDDEHRALFVPPIQCALSRDCRDLGRKQRAEL